MAATATADKEAMADIQKHWWVFLVRGIVAILFGLVTVAQPDLTTAFLALYFGLFLAIYGVLDIVFGIANSKNGDVNWVLMIILGAIELGFGVYILQRPALSIASFVVFIALALMVRGVFDIISAIVDKTADGGMKTLSIFAGIAAILAGIIIWRYPVEGTLAFVWVLGLFALISGPIWIAGAFKLRDAEL